MLRKGLFALVMLVLCFTFVTAETIKGRITKISADSVSIRTGKDKEAKSYPIDKDCKFIQLEKKDDKEGKTIEGGVKASVFKDISDKGLGATIEVNDTSKKVTSITLSAKKKS